MDQSWSRRITRAVAPLEQVLTTLDEAEAPTQPVIFACEAGVVTR